MHLCAKLALVIIFVPKAIHLHRTQLVETAESTEALYLASLLLSVLRFVLLGPSEPVCNCSNTRVYQGAFENSYIFSHPTSPKYLLI
jgi:hypothetical protein